MNVITYSLKANGTGSDQYYRDVAAFTDEVLAEADQLAHSTVESYRSYLQATKPGVLSAREEHAFEILMLGTLWQVYSDDALGLPELPGHLLTHLADLRQQGGSLKPGIDFLRGILSTLFLSTDDHTSAADVEPTLEHLDHLIHWLEATGEFRNEVKRLASWREFLATFPPRAAADHLATAITFAAWFRARSEAVLGGYTEQVEQFLAERYAQHRWREDVIFCGKQRVEYHLNMVGAEIMNRVFRPAFDRKKHKAVLVPGCMRLLPEGLCQAEATALGARCTGCTAGCRVHQLTRMGQKHGFDVRILSHESSLSKDAAAGAQDLAIVGIACVTNLVAGGWKAKDLGLPAQCVLLDYCGCKNHWDDEGIPTDINLKQLRQVMGVEAPLTLTVRTKGA